MNDNKKKWYESLIDGILDFVYKSFVFVSKFLVLVLAVVCGISAYVNLAEKGYFDNSKSSSTFIRASADEASTVSTSTVADVESGLDLTQYPSANLIPFNMADYERSYTINGVTFTVDSDGTFTANGTATAASIFVIHNFDFTLQAGTYAVSGAVGGSSSSYLVQIATGGYAQAWNGTSGTVFALSKEEKMLVQLVVYKGYTANNLVFKPMINRGNMAYPYIPPFDAIYNGGYDNGYDQGKEEGLDYARAGYWLDVTVGVDFNGTSNGVEVSDGLVIYPTVTSMGIDLSNVYTEINAKYPNLSLGFCEFTLYFNSPVIIENLKLRCMGDLSVVTDDTLSSLVYDPVTGEYEDYLARFAYIDGSELVSGLQFALEAGSQDEADQMFDALKRKQICSITSYNVQDISQFKGLRFYTTDTLAGINYEAGRVAGYSAGSKESYEAGKADGFDLGKEEGETIGYEAGKSDGFELGKKEGFAEGLYKGLSDDPYGFGDFIYTALDMPGRLLSNLLNFDFMGVNLAGLVAVIFSLFLAHWVIKKIT